MKVSFLLLLLVTGFSTNLLASEDLSQFDESCRFIYRNAYLELSNDVDGFNQKILSKYEMSSRLASLSLEITSSKNTCDHMNADVDVKCISEYQDLYTSLRNKLTISDIISGKQTNVDRGPLGSDKTKEKIRLGIIDLKCKN